MSGGVDSSVAAALLADAGHDVVGATLKLWGGPSDSGCCSVSDVDDARRVAEQIGVPHHVFNFTEVFEQTVVDPYVASHALGRTPNPCIECNRHVKFGRLLERAERLGFDALATGHHARVSGSVGEAGRRLVRGVDAAKDQSYVLSMLTGRELARLALPIGHLTKGEVRDVAGRLGLRTARKPDSQEVCFIHSTEGRGPFLAGRIALHPGEVVDRASGAVVGRVPAVELVTVGQRRGLGVGTGGRRRFALSVDVAARRIEVGDADTARASVVSVEATAWSGPPLEPGERALVQVTAHGHPAPGRFRGSRVIFDRPQPLVAAGQTVAFYDVRRPEVVVGSALACEGDGGDGRLATGRVS